MADNTAIEWADRTWNPLLGCERVSPGCDACYAIRTARIRAGHPHPNVAAAFEGLTEYRDGRLDWTGRINLLHDRLLEPLSWRKPQKVFVNSQSDLFHKDVPDEFIARVFGVMARTPQHTYQVLTKRHGRMRSLLRGEDGSGHRLIEATRDEATAQALYGQWPLPNLWLGVSVESQQWADIRVPALLDTPAAVRWLSCEPLLGPVRLADEWLSGSPYRRTWVNWVVVGGESGPDARPMHPGWARSLRDQCDDFGVPFFFKQWGDWSPVRPVGPSERGKVQFIGPQGEPFDERNPPEMDPAWATLYRRGKKAAGRELDGRTWDEYPTSPSEASRAA